MPLVSCFCLQEQRWANANTSIWASCIALFSLLVKLHYWTSWALATILDQLQTPPHMCKQYLSIALCLCSTSQTPTSVQAFHTRHIGFMSVFASRTSRGKCTDVCQHFNSYKTYWLQNKQGNCKDVCKHLNSYRTYWFHVCVAFFHFPGTSRGNGKDVCRSFFLPIPMNRQGQLQTPPCVQALHIGHVGFMSMEQTGAIAKMCVITSNSYRTYGHHACPCFFLLIPINRQGQLQTPPCVQAIHIGHVGFMSGAMAKMWGSTIQGHISFMHLFLSSDSHEQAITKTFIYDMLVSCICWDQSSTCQPQAQPKADTPDKDRLD